MDRFKFVIGKREEWDEITFIVTPYHLLTEHVFWTYDDAMNDTEPNTDAHRELSKIRKHIQHVMDLRDTVTAHNKKL